MATAEQARRRHGRGLTGCDVATCSCSVSGCAATGLHPVKQQHWYLLCSMLYKGCRSNKISNRVGLSRLGGLLPQPLYSISGSVAWLTAALTVAAAAAGSGGRRASQALSGNWKMASPSSR